MAAPRPGSTPSAEATILRVGAEGDGVAEIDGHVAHVPFALPGERVRIGGGPPEIVAASAERVVPPCPHFGVCGGCALQHWADAPYAAWKHGLLGAALRRAGFEDAAPAAIRRAAPATRRRVDLAIRRQGGRVVLGLHRRGATEVVDLSTCLVLDPAIVPLFAPLRALLAGASLLRREGSAVLNRVDDGIDLLFRSDAPPGAADRTALAGFAARHGIPRIAWAPMRGEPEAMVSLRPAVRTFGDVAVPMPPGAFQQASPAGEAAIVAAVLDGLPEHLPRRAVIVELFAGVGTLSFPIGARHRVRAFEGDAAAWAALRRGAGGTRVEAVHRDLARQPLSAKECSGAAAVVLDPPWVGAAPQMREIAASGVPRVVYVSCNPAALTRDARVLRDAGYAVRSAVPIDQFLWSPRLESVVVFSR